MAKGGEGRDAKQAEAESQHPGERHKVPLVPANVLSYGRVAEAIAAVCWKVAMAFRK